MTEVIPFRREEPSDFAEERAVDVLARCRWQVCAVLLVCLGIHLLFFANYYFTFDDAYVFHVYARNVARGAGFSFNPGETSHAATPLLTFVLAAQHFLLQDGALVSSKFVDLCFSMGAAVLLFLVAYRISNSNFIAFGSSLVWAASPLESMLSAGPQDFTLFTFLILLSVFLHLYYSDSLWTYVVLSLVIVTRYEGALFAGLLYLNQLFNEYRAKELRVPRLLLRLLLMSVIPALWFAYIGTHATLLPSSGSAKLDPWAIRKVPHFIAGVAIFFFLPMMLAAIVAAFSQLLERTPRLIFLFVWVAFCLFFYGPFLDNRRYYIHLLPFLALFSLSFLKSASELYFKSARLSQVFLFGTISLSFFSYFCTNLYYYNETHKENRMTAYPAYRETGIWLHANTPTTATIAAEEIGVIPYFADRKLVDFSGWLDINAKQFREKSDGINPPMLKYLSEKRPDYIIINTDLVSKPRQLMLATDPRLTLVQRVPVLESDSVLIYACKW